MATGYTETQLEELREEVRRHAPPHPGTADLKTAPTLSRIATAGTEMGALVRLALKARERPITFFLNPVIAQELMFGLNEAALTFKWWEKPVGTNTKPLPDLIREDLEGALQVRSITTASEPNGLLVRFAGGDNFTCYIPRKFAAEIVSMLNNIGETARWWDAEYRLLAKPH